ncbi:hypothetical protein ACIQU6_07590 [Streptomyces sp. NPDC090442]|uniref:hypothetical protein n=1 Tax=Streptomyces sp. NPDC090442 TaxID=3365962 RepID=UPI0038134ACF
MSEQLEIPGAEADREGPKDAPEVTVQESNSTLPPEHGRTEPDTRDAEIAALRKQIEEAAPILQAHKDAEEARKSEAQKLTEALEAARAEAADARRVVMRAKVAEATGLPSDVVALLSGNSEEDLMGAAKAVAAISSPRGSGLPKRPTPTVSTGQEKPEAPEVVDPRKLAAAIRKAAGRF